jgi:hypothetical protein
MIDHLVDDRLTAQGLMKFKRLHSIQAYNAVLIPVVVFPFAYLANRWICGIYYFYQGFVDRGIGQSRFNFIGMGIFYPIFLYWGYTRPLPRKLYTDVICDNGDDGTYIRQILKNRKPGLWRKISSQLHENNFSFPEMIEYKGI